MEGKDDSAEGALRRRHTHGVSVLASVPVDVIDVLPRGAQQSQPAHLKVVGVGGAVEPRVGGRPGEQAAVRGLLGQGVVGGIRRAGHDVDGHRGRELRQHHVHLPDWGQRRGLLAAAGVGGALRQCLRAAHEPARNHRPNNLRRAAHHQICIPPFLMQMAAGSSSMPLSKHGQTWHGFDAVIPHCFVAR